MLRCCSACCPAQRSKSSALAVGWLSYTQVRPGRAAAMPLASLQAAYGQLLAAVEYAAACLVLCICLPIAWTVELYAGKQARGACCLRIAAQQYLS